MEIESCMHHSDISQIDFAFSIDVNVYNKIIRKIFSMGENVFPVNGYLNE